MVDEWNSVKKKLESDAFGRGPKHKKKKTQLFDPADSEVKTDVKSIPESEQLYKDKYTGMDEKVLSEKEFRDKQFQAQVESAKKRRIKAEALEDMKGIKAAQDELKGLAKKADSEDMVDAFRKAIKGSGKAMKSVVGAVPVLGGIGAALMSGDASAALPGDISSSGPEKGMFDYDWNDPNLSKEKREEMLRQVKERLNK